MKHIYLSVIFFLFAATSAGAFTVGDIDYDFNGASTLKVISKWPNYKGSVNIPSTVQYSGKNYTVTEIERMAFLNAEFVTDITLPPTLFAIGDNAFAGCTGIKSIIIPDGVVTIGARAFADCSSLTDVTLSNTLDIIESSLFFQCTRLKNVAIPKSVHTIRNMAFGYSGIERINIDKNVTQLESFIFEGCVSLKRLDIDDYDFWCHRDFNSSNENPLVLARNLYVNGELLTKITIPPTMTEVKPFTFFNCSASEVEFHKDVHTIDLSAFIGCNRIRTVLFPNTVTKLISDKVKLGSSSNAVFNSMNNMTIGSGLKEIPFDSFDYCTNLSNVIFQEGVESLSNYSFGYTGALNVVLPSSIRRLTQSFYASKIVSITLNSGLKEISGGVLANCLQLKEIHSRIKNPNQVQFLSQDCFMGIKGCTLYVPKGTLQQYRSHAYWSLLLNAPSNSIQEEPEFITDVNRDGRTDVEDVNLAINLILHVDYPGTNITASDVNCDDRVDVEDVNAIINAILKL